MIESLLRGGSRVAILGGGPAGACLAASLLAASRRLRKLIEVTLYHSSSQPDELAEPLIIDEPTCVRLASLGVGVPQGYLTSYRGIIYHGARASTPSFELRRPISIVTPGAPAAAFRRMLRGVASGLGARLVPSEGRGLAPIPGAANPARVASRGLTQNVDLLVTATGVRGPASRDADGHPGPALIQGGGLWLRTTSPLPTRFTSRLYLFTLPRARVFVVPVGQRLFLTGVGDPDRSDGLLGAVVELQRSGLLPTDLQVDREWARLFPAAPAGLAEGRLMIGEASGPLWPLTAFGTTVAHCLRMAEDALALPTAPEPGQRQHRRSLACHRATGERWRLASSMGEVAEVTRGRATAFDWLFGGDDSASPPALGWIGGIVLGRAIARGLRRLGRWLTRRGSAAGIALPTIGRSNVVYLVDDDPAACFALATWLVDRGVRVRTFTDELSVAAAAARERPAAILLDLILRRVDGHTVLDWLREEPSTAEIPVLFISGSETPGAPRIRPYAFLQKPLNPGQLWDILRPLIARPEPLPAAAEVA